MENRHKKLFQKNNYYICNHLDIKNNSKIIDFLYEQKILLPNRFEEINNIDDNFKKVELLLTILPTRGKKSLEIFFDSLQHGTQNYIRETLLECLGEEESSEKYGELEKESLDMIDCRERLKRMILIINNNKFKTVEPRYGSLKDTEELQEFFVNTLKYELFNGKPFIDQSAKQIVNVVGEFSRATEEEKAEFVVVIIMSHGSAGYIYGTDEEVVDIRRLLECFSRDLDSVYNAFIFSCCRGGGDAFSSVKAIPESRENIISTDGACSVVDCINDDRLSYKKQVKWRDAPPKSLVIYSTQINIKSYRYETGTIFIQALLSVFKKYYKSDYLSEMIMKVKEEMRKLYPEFEQLPDIKENRFAKIML